MNFRFHKHILYFLKTNILLNSKLEKKQRASTERRMDKHMAFMESTFSPGWMNRIKMIMPETQMTVPIDEYIRNIDWNALEPSTNNNGNREKTNNNNAFPLNQSRLGNLPHPNNALRPNSLLNPNQIPIRYPPPPIISRTNSFPIGGNVQGHGYPNHQGQQNHQANRNGNVGAGQMRGNDKMQYYKTSLCKSFTIHGYCNYGPSCLFAHGEHDLRKFHNQQNISAITRALNNNVNPQHAIYNVNGTNHHRNRNIPQSGQNNANNNGGKMDLRQFQQHQNVGPPPPIRPSNMNINNNARPPPVQNSNNDSGPSRNNPSGSGGGGQNKMYNNKRPAAI